MHALPTLRTQPPAFGSMLIVLSSAAVITFALFVAMHKLVANDQITRIAPKEYPTIELTHNFEEEPPKERTRIKPKPLPQPKPEPIDRNLKNEPKLALINNSSIPNIGSPIVKNKFVPTFNESGGEARPIVRVEPKYPIAAARDGIEGWVKLSFSITSSGTVNNIEVIDAEPKRTFNKAAKRALSKWKYKPNIQAGKALAQDGMMVMLDFKLSS